jgi:hypothetical protein
MTWPFYTLGCSNWFSWVSYKLPYHFQVIKFKRAKIQMFLYVIFKTGLTYSVETAMLKSECKLWTELDSKAS